MLASLFRHLRQSLPNTGRVYAAWRTKEDFAKDEIPQILLEMLPEYGTLTQGKWDERETFEYQHASKCYLSPLARRNDACLLNCEPGIKSLCLSFTRQVKNPSFAFARGFGRRRADWPTPSCGTKSLKTYRKSSAPKSIYRVLPVLYVLDLYVLDMTF